MWPAIAAGAWSAGLALSGANRAQKVNAKEAQKNRDFQERMRNTSYQAAVKDMQLAGLNPALAYEKGGADTPSGTSTAPMDNALATTGATAAQAAQTLSSISLQQAQAKKTNAEANYVALQNEAQLEMLRYQMRQTGVNTAKAYQDLRFGADTYNTRLHILGSEKRQKFSDAEVAEATQKDRIRLQAILPNLSQQQYEMIGLGKNEAQAWSDFYGGIGHGMPWLTTALDVLKTVPLIGKLFQSPRKTIINQFRRP